jgi:sulfur carrier protein
MINVNGDVTDLLPGDALLTALARVGVEPGSRGVAVAVDGEVVPRAAWESFALGDDADVEVLTAMQGG